MIPLLGIAFVLFGFLLVSYAIKHGVEKQWRGMSVTLVVAAFFMAAALVPAGVAMLSYHPH